MQNKAFRPRLYRAPDYPPALRAAVNEMERAEDRLIDAKDGDAYETALANVKKWRRRYGFHLRRLDMQRRPEAYRKD